MLNINAVFEVIGKPEPRPYVGNDGKQAFSYKLNIAQNDGVDVSTISTNESVYNKVKRGDVAEFVCTYAEYGDRVSFRIADVVQFKNMPVGSSVSGMKK